MTLQIGRTVIAGPMDWRNQGDQLTIKGKFSAGTAATALVLRDELLGYDGNVNEPVIPIISTADDKLSGYYRIAGVDVPTTRETLLSTGVFEYALQGTRITTFRSAAMESVLAGALMVNDHAINSVTAQPFHSPGIPGEYNFWASGMTRVQRQYWDFYSSAAANLDWYQTGSTYAGLARYAVDVASFYAGAGVIFNSAGVNHIVVGKQDAPTTTGWSLTNGLVLVSYNGNTFDVYWTTGGSNTRSHKQVFISGSITTTIHAFSGNVRILWNSPELVIIRVPFVPDVGIQYGPLYVDISLRRGSRAVRFYSVLPSNVSPQTWTFGHAFAGIAGTALTGGVVETANDGDGNRSVIMTSKAKTNSLANGRFTTTSALTAFDCGIALEAGGTGASGFDTAQSQIYQYLAAQAERMRVVGR